MPICFDSKKFIGQSENVIIELVFRFPGFNGGNVGWRLKVGEIGTAGFDAKNSPYGWHIIKRLK